MRSSEPRRRQYTAASRLGAHWERALQPQLRPQRDDGHLRRVGASDLRAHWRPADSVGGRHQAPAGSERVDTARQAADTRASILLDVDGRQAPEPGDAVLDGKAVLLLALHQPATRRGGGGANYIWISTAQGAGKKVAKHKRPGQRFTAEAKLSIVRRQGRLKIIVRRQGRLKISSARLAAQD